MTNLRCWQSLWHRIGGQSEAEAHFAELKERYSEPHRAYHTLDHIRDCLSQFDLARHQAARPDEVEFALWLHDVIYDPHASDNEEKSAQWAVDMLHQGAVSAAVTARVAELIMVTRHITVPDDLDAQLVVDIDLSILGRAPNVFAAYEDQIRHEYNWVPEEVYRQERARILERFLARPAIYQTSFFRARYEVQARRNLKQSILRIWGEAG